MAGSYEYNNENPEYSKDKYLQQLKVYHIFSTDCTLCNLLVGWFVIWFVG
jgi:hypothetical protein